MNSVRISLENCPPKLHIQCYLLGHRCFQLILTSNVALDPKTLYSAAPLNCYAKVRHPITEIKVPSATVVVTLICKKHTN